MIPGKQYTPDEVLAIVWRRKWLVLCSVVLFGAGAFALARVLPARFQSETMIMVVPQRVPETYVRSTVSTRIEDRLKTISQQILSRVRLEKIINEFDLYKQMRATRSMDDVIARMRGDIDVRIVGADTFRVAYTSGSAELAQRVTERLASLFIEENLRDREVVADDTSVFLESQLQDARRQLESQERKLAEFRRQHAGELPTQLEANQQLLQNTQLQLQAIEDSLNRDRDRRLALDRELSDLTAAPATSLSGPAGAPSDAALTAQALDKAQAELRDLSSKYTDEHPDVIRAKREVRDLQAKLGRETASGGPAAIPSTSDTLRQQRARQLRNDLDTADRQIAQKQAEEERLRRQMDDIGRRIDATPTRESELTALTRDYQTVSQLYSNLLAKREDSKIAANLERRQIGEQFKVLDPARVPERPIFPNKIKLVLFGSAFGMALGLALIGLFEYRNSGLRTEDEVAACTGLPVIAVIPIMVPLDGPGRIPRVGRLRGTLPPRSALPAGTGPR